MIREELSTLHESNRDDRRYVDSSNPRAVFQAWAGKSKRNATVDMSGWTDERGIDGFVQAFEDEMDYSGSFYDYVEIIDADTGDVVTTL